MVLDWVGLVVPQPITLSVSPTGTCFPPDSGKGAWTLLQMRQLRLTAEAPSAATGEHIQLGSVIFSASELKHFWPAAAWSPCSMRPGLFWAAQCVLHAAVSTAKSCRPAGNDLLYMENLLKTSCL